MTTLPPDTDLTYKDFYIPGGVLPKDAQSYVERQADTDLYNNLMQGRYCYVLTARQVGKSSLMVKTATRLAEAGVAVAMLDLTGAGQNLSAEQWYYGLLDKTGRRLDLEDELDDYWLDHSQLGPLQRWMGALRDIVLTRYTGKVVIFIDEIDAVRSLPFPTDEFFTGIRELYNGRQMDQALDRLTFCLLGAAQPSDLVADLRLAPFNIAKRIDLTDFTESEASPLAKGIAHKGKSSSELIKRVLYWTGGHPYLTQCLCQALTEEPSVNSVRRIDQVCERLFLSSRAREQDDNLQYVSKRILDNGSNTSGVLSLYVAVHKHKCPKDRQSKVNRILYRNKCIEKGDSPLQDVLEITGIVRLVEECFRVRNRIYHHVFDRRWAKENMPETALRQQLADYRRWLLKAAIIAGLIIFVVGGLAVYAFIQSKRTHNALAIAQTKQEEATALIDALEKAKTQRDEAEEQRHQAQHQAEDRAWQADVMAWQMIMDETNPVTFKAYLEIFDKGGFSPKAKKTYERLTDPSRVSDATPPTKGVIRGQVYEAETQPKRPIMGAKIQARIKVNDTYWELMMFSNKDGEFLLAPLPQGFYTITISSDGYESKIKKVQVDNVNEILRLPIGLTPIPPKPS